jgi:HK97 gp10 family phage protein
MDTVEVVGLDDLLTAFSEMQPQMVKRALHDALDLGGTVLQTALAEAAPRYEGDATPPHPAGQLEADIRRVVKMKPAEGQGIVAVGPSAASFYGAFDEFGTSHQEAKPWVRPAFDSSVDEAMDVFDQVLSAYIDEFCKEQGGK